MTEEVSSNQIMAKDSESNSRLKRAKSISNRRTLGLFKKTARKFLTKKGRDDLKKKAFSKVRCHEN